jgi:hypothetical protein
MSNPPPLTPADLIALFPATRLQPIKAGAFELGLCLGGTVSAGAYTGGVLDFLIEAFDAWTLAKESDPLAPQHDVVISTLAGASGGAINGAILLRAAGWEFDHGAATSNPFYTSWTTGVDLMKLLSPTNNSGTPGLASIFDCGAIDDQAASTIAYQGRPLGIGKSPTHRSYLADPLRLVMMVGNVTGLPYSISMKGDSGLSHDLVAHADFVRFALTVEDGVANPPQMRPDEFALSSVSPLNWDQLRAAALATSAFPLAFMSRPLSRRLEVCGYRAVAIPAENGVGTVVQLIPKWDTLKTGEPDPTMVNFVNVDGGTTNNQPLDVVRMALAGLDGRNKRSPGAADRAVILIDPFCDPEALGPHTPPSLIGLALPFVMSLVYQARYKPVDIALAYDEDTYSRYLIAPVGPGYDGSRTVGKAAIASGGLGGFLGFVDSSFLQYDYALGRLNAFTFLTKHLALPESANNPIHTSWTAPQKNEYRFFENGVAYLPIVPVMKSLQTQPPTLPPWPKLSAMPSWLSGAITNRLDALYDQATSALDGVSWWKRTIASAYLRAGWNGYLRGAARDYALAALQTALQEQHLL